MRLSIGCKLWARGEQQVIESADVTVREIEKVTGHWPRWWESNGTFVLVTETIVGHFHSFIGLCPMSDGNIHHCILLEPIVNYFPCASATFVCVCVCVSMCVCVCIQWPGFIWLVFHIFLHDVYMCVHVCVCVCRSAGREWFCTDGAEFTQRSCQQDSQLPHTTGEHARKCPSQLARGDFLADERNWLRRTQTSFFHLT